ncbi:hypothetical protein C7S20_18190 [Christiangramia fulva]|uniref:Uncharacterized protein n=1 Tax=Christiangramia fulva TaxID=2126553 RepID=A0A2R3ZA22_9FLAO|nr:hypothetical protein [Christiangramia fulva]AVR47022.1 hypothetical protein C7S20_18190 [Christiangramia fulva]
MKNHFRIVLSFFALLIVQGITAQETSVMIRAKAKDAKFIGSSIGGAKIIVRNNLTGEILDQGITSGGTGNTDRIMKEDWKRHVTLSDENTAGFLAHLDIREPLFVTVEAYAPFNKKQATIKSSTQFWVIPGKDILGDGIVLEIPGFVVDILSPQTHEVISAEEKIEIKANIVMMCGCPVTDGGIWDASEYEIKARITGEDGKTSEVALKQTEKSSTFSAETKLAPGLYEVMVYAFDPSTGNTGLDKTNIIVRGN